MTSAIALSVSPGGGASMVIIGVSLRVTPTTWEMWMWLRPKVRGMWELTSTKNGT